MPQKRSTQQNTRDDLADHHRLMHSAEEPTEHAGGQDDQDNLQEQEYQRGRCISANVFGNLVSK